MYCSKHFSTLCITEEAGVRHVLTSLPFLRPPSSRSQSAQLLPVPPSSPRQIDWKTTAGVQGSTFVAVLATCKMSSTAAICVLAECSSPKFQLLDKSASPSSRGSTETSWSCLDRTVPSAVSLPAFSTHKMSIKQLSDTNTALEKCDRNGELSRLQILSAESSMQAPCPSAE